MNALWRKARGFASRIRGVSTPFGGLSWEAAADAAPAADDSDEQEGPHPEQAEEAANDFCWEEIYDEILCEVVEAPRRGLTIRQVCNRLDLSAIRAEHHLESLEEIGLLELFDGRYILAPPGRQYLIDADLVQ